jgi:Flp pilus assembly pilin Flp
MFKKLMKNKKAQNTAEYAILISLVVAGIIAMQTYAQRALQARVRDAGQYLASETDDLGTTVQYEPYYLSTNYTVVRNEDETQVLDNVTTRQQTNSTRTREMGGFQESSYDTSLNGLINGL